MNTLRPYQTDLVNEVKQSYIDGHKTPCIVLPCGGGKSCIAAEIAKRTTNKGNRVLFIVHREEICTQIRETFEWWGVDMSLCRIGMVQTITRRVKKIHEPTLIITDEGHHGLANSYKRIYEYFPNARRVGITATPIRLNGGGLGDVNDKLIVGVSTKWLIDNNYLAQFDYYAPPIVDLTGLHIKSGDFIPAEVTEKLNKSAIYGDVIKYYKQLSDGKQAICYCASVVHSKAMTANFNAASISAAHVDGETLRLDRKQIIDDFRAGKTMILCCVDIVGEGFDVPDCNTAILLRPTKSMVIYIQQSMRCMRYVAGKKAVIIDHVGNAFRFGLPDMERVWDLTPAKKGTKKEESEISVRQCPECFACHEPAPVCPQCGFIYPIKERTIEEIKDAKLELITNIVLDYTTPESCGTLEELRMYGKAHNYKPGWSFYQAKRRGLM